MGQFELLERSQCMILNARKTIVFWGNNLPKGVQIRATFVFYIFTKGTSPPEGLLDRSHKGAQMCAPFALPTRPFMHLYHNARLALTESSLWAAATASNFCPFWAEKGRALPICQRSITSRCAASA
jgi:hypothetical protein